MREQQQATRATATPTPTATATAATMRPSAYVPCVLVAIKAKYTKTNHGLYGLLYGGDYGKVVAFHMPRQLKLLRRRKSIAVAYAADSVVAATEEHKMRIILF